MVLNGRGEGESCSSVLSAGPLGGVDEVNESGLSLRPSTRLQSAIWVNEEAGEKKGGGGISMLFGDRKSVV